MQKATRARGAEVRSRIERAAMELVCEVGHGGITTRLLAERAGVAPGLVHYHYRSIDDAVRTAMLAAIDGLVSDFARAADEVETPHQALDVVWAMLAPERVDQAASVLALESVLAATRDPELRRRMGEAVIAFRKILQDRLIEAGVEEPEATAAVLAAVIDGVMMHRVLFTDEPSDLLYSEAARAVTQRIINQEGRP